VPPKRAGVADVVGIGQNTTDHLCVVQRFPGPDEKQRLVAYDVQPGGQVATALVALARWGVPTAYAGAFGDDDAGARGRASLHTAGVDVSAAAVRTATANQVSVVLVDAGSGERTVLWSRAPALALDAGEVPRQAIAAARAVLVDGIDPAAACVAARAARAAGVPVVADVDRSCPDPAAVLPLVDVLLVSWEFARVHTGAARPDDALAALARYGAPVVGVTLGRDGALVAADRETVRLPAHRVGVVDTTGAGDLFHAGFVWALLDGRVPAEAARIANAAAALQCAALGGRAAIPALADVRALAGL
jgi:sugar/nucleoside kinase (ribokinase family)